MDQQTDPTNAKHVQLNDALARLDAARKALDLSCAPEVRTAADDLFARFGAPLVAALLNARYALAEVEQLSAELELSLPPENGWPFGASIMASAHRFHAIRDAILDRFDECVHQARKEHGL